MIVDGAAFTVWATDPEPRITQLGQPADRVRCASVLKPIYFWAASSLPAFRDDLDGWAELAEPAVTASSNDPTVAIWQECTPDALLDAIAGLTGVRWHSDPSAERSFGRVLVRADEVARAYAALAVVGLVGGRGGRPRCSAGCAPFRTGRRSAPGPPLRMRSESARRTWG